MNADLSRRGFLGAMAAGGALLTTGAASAQTGNGLLAKLQQSKLVKVGIVNGPPYSALNPDGTLGGVAPTITGLIMNRLGVPKMEGIAVEYGQLIPGLQAGRWDMIGAAMTITKARCELVTYCDPFLIDGGAFAYIPKNLPNPPKSFKEVGQQIDRVGLVVGAAMMPLVQDAVKASGRSVSVTQYPGQENLTEALMTDRIQVAITGIISLRQMRTARKNAFEIVYPVPDDFAHGSGPAFRPTDTDLSVPFNREFQLMKKSGEAQKIIESFGFTVQKGDTDLTAEEACRLSI